MTDGELVEVFGIGRLVSRRPYRYATSATLEELEVEGSERLLIFKDVDRPIGDTSTAKPAFLYDPTREIETYRQILAPAGVGPRCMGAVAEPGRHWLLLEKVVGVELWQIGELEVWEEVARWLGAFHRDFAGQQRANSWLINYAEPWFETWLDRATAALHASEDLRAPELLGALERYDEVIAALVSLPSTLVHGEFYPSNVLVTESPVDVYPIDWEMAGVGTGLLDLAALVGGWDVADAEKLVRAYGPGVGSFELGCCRLHLALQWLGWSADWRPPPEHAHDWLGEALWLVGELRLV